MILYILLGISLTLNMLLIYYIHRLSEVVNTVEQKLIAVEMQRDLENINLLEYTELEGTYKRNLQ